MQEITPRGTFELREKGNLEAVNFAFVCQTWEGASEIYHRLKDCALVAEMMGEESERSFRRCLVTLTSFATDREASGDYKACQKRVRMMWDCELSFLWREEGLIEGETEWQNGFLGGMIFHPRYEHTGPGDYDRRAVPGGEWSIHT